MFFVRRDFNISVDVWQKIYWFFKTIRYVPDSKVHGTNMGPTWARQDPGRPHVGPINFAIWDVKCFVITAWCKQLIHQQVKSKQIATRYLPYVTHRSDLGSYRCICAMLVKDLKDCWVTDGNSKTRQSGFNWQSTREHDILFLFPSDNSCSQLMFFVCTCNRR